MEWIKWDIHAFRRDTASLTLREIGVYLSLLLVYYRMNGPLPTDLRWLKNETNCRDRWDHQALIKVLSLYFQIADDGFYHNKRADKELIEYKRRQEASYHANRIRWDSEPHSEPDSLNNTVHTKKILRESPKRRICEVKGCNKPFRFETIHGSHPRCEDHWPI